MDFILKVSSGEEILLQPGSSVTIGRDAMWNDCAFPSDAFMSPVHFQINVHDVEVSLRDLNSRDGTWVNGIRCHDAVLSPGDVITAGQVTFVFQPVSADETETDEEKSDSTPDGNFPASPLLDEMRKLGERLYALFDLARDPQILEMLGAAGADAQSLFEGEGSARLITVAPHLVGLDKDSQLLEDLLREGWGKSWGYYLTSPESFQPLRRHLRKFLMVKDEDGRELYFRFYDPRVIRLFLPTCTPEEATEFFGSAARLWVEDEDPGMLLEFTRDAGGIQSRKWPLKPTPEAQTADRVS